MPKFLDAPQWYNSAGTLVTGLSTSSSVSISDNFNITIPYTDTAGDCVFAATQVGNTGLYTVKGYYSTNIDEYVVEANFFYYSASSSAPTAIGALISAISGLGCTSSSRLFTPLTYTIYNYNTEEQFESLGCYVSGGNLIFRCLSWNFLL